jgi:hypothetical protein
MLHLVKLCVGCASIAELASWQARRAVTDPPLRHQTRNMPRRAAEIAGQGSLYWVIGGAILVRQRIEAVIEDHWDDGTRCAGLVLDRQLVPTLPRPMRPFQGWRYLEPDQAPADRPADGHPDRPSAPRALRPAGMAEAQAEFGDMPDTLRRELRALGLL